MAPRSRYRLELADCSTKQSFSAVALLMPASDLGLYAVALTVYKSMSP